MHSPIFMDEKETKNGNNKHKKNYYKNYSKRK